MKTSIAHLPETKQREILDIVEIIKGAVQAEKIILFGSYATGDWVEDTYFENGIKYDYISDYDFLIVTKEDNEKVYESVEKILAHTRSKFSIPVSPIIHSVTYVDKGLEEGQYFFKEIIDEGILLFDTNIVEFKKPKNLSRGEQREIASRYFSLWYPKAASSLAGAQFYFSKEYINDAAFALHQTAERLYNTVLLVFTGYKPKTHNIDKLRTYIKAISQPLFAIFPFPVKDEEENRLFEILKRAYIDARYKDDYIISKEDFKTLVVKLEKMQKIVEGICREKIASLN
ncbi:MAG: HEPN domain-containing protein [Niabella sp.]|nr:HEPN domain-containing protein [Niabella sp.]